MATVAFLELRATKEKPSFHFSQKMALAGIFLKTEFH
jgi:hypothetical protein